jgi:sugar phosphate isomerase/epimerase
MPMDNRRGFLQFTTAVAMVAVARELFAHEPVDTSNKAFRLGLLVSVAADPDKVMALVHGHGLPTAHVIMRDFSDAMAPRLRSALDRYEVEATVFISSGPGEDKYDLVDGPTTFGLIPSRYRRERIDHLKRASDFAKLVGIPAVFNQWGYIPEVPSDPLYQPTVEAVREIASHCRGNGQMFLNETGQETPTTLLRTIQDAGMDNVGICLDAANLVLYGKGNPVDALDVLGKYVRAVHAKGGFYPTDPRYLGKQVPAYEPNKVDWPLLIRRLKEIGYDGTITIEDVTREPERDNEIRGDKAYLEKLIAQG